MTQTEAIILGLVTRAQACMAKIAAMQAFNAGRLENQSSGYQEEAFFACESELTEIANEIFRLSSKLSIDPPDVNIVGTSGLFGLNITSSREKFT